MNIARLKSIIKKATWNLIRSIQAILMFLLLTIIYFLGFGITFIVMAVFKPRVLRGARENDASFWVTAQGYEADLKDSMRQS